MMKKIQGEKRSIKSSPYFVYIPLIPVLLVLFGYVVYPLFKTFLNSVMIDGNINFANYKDFFNVENVTYIQSLKNSVYISLISVITCGIVGIGLALLMERFDFPGRRVLTVIAILPMALPSLIGTISFDFLYGESGIIPRFLQHLFSLNKVPFYLNGIAGVIMVHTFTMYTYFFLPVSSAIRNFDTSMEEAAYNLGASKWTVFTRVIIPMLTPSIVASSLLVFMMSMASYTAPLIYGIDNTLTMQIYLSRTNGNLDMAATQSTILSLVSIMFLILMRWYENKRNYKNVNKGVGVHRTEVKNKWGKYVAAIASFILVIFLMLPIIVIILISFSQDGTWTTQILPPKYTLDHYKDLFTNAKTWIPIKNSVVMSSIATLGNAVFGLGAAYLLSRFKFRGNYFVDSIIMIPWSLPGTVVAINLIAAFNRPSFFSFGKILVGTYWILPLAYFVRHLPLVYRSTSASFAQMDGSAEEAARNLGAGWFYSFRKVVIPMVFSGMAAGMLLGFVQGIGEFVASILLYTVNTTPISVEIFQRMYSFEFGTACAYGVLQIILLVIVLFASERLKGESTSAI